MRKFLVLIFIFLPALSIAAVATPSTYKGMWSWRDSDIINPTAQQNLLNFAVANGVNDIYVSAQWLIDNSPSQLEAFINNAANKGISVELLYADPTWALTANHQQALDQISKANTFINSLTGARPVALHFDVEQHSLSDWGSNQISYGNQLIDLYAKIMAAKNPNLLLNIDIAMGYEYVNITRSGVTKTLTQWLIDTTDRTTLMDYRDFASGVDGIVDHANHPVNYAATKGKLAYIGAETNCGLTPQKVTFCEEGRSSLDTELWFSKSNYSCNQGFGGIAIHDYAGYSTLH